MMQAAEYGFLYNPISDRQTMSVLVGRNLVRHGLRQTGAQRRMGPSAVIVDCPISNRHLQTALVEEIRSPDIRDEGCRPVVGIRSSPLGLAPAFAEPVPPDWQGLGPPTPRRCSPDHG